MARKKAATGAGSAALVLVGADKPKLRRPSKRDWTEAKQRDFLTALAETCNVSRAAEEAGVSVSSAYRRRKSNAAFRAGWLEAIGSETITLSASPVAAIQGIAETTLAGGQAALIDRVNSVEIVLANSEDWIESVDDEALVNGANLALVGRELIQFGEAVAIGTKRFRLSRLLRGRRGTEWATSLHQPGEPFLLVDPARLKRADIKASNVGARISVTPRGLADGNATAVELEISGEAMRPPSPVHLRATMRADGGAQCSWVRRSSRGWAWLNSVDSPLASATERYRVSLRGDVSERQVETSAPSLAISAAELAELGGGNVTIAVVQVGDYAASRPAELLLPIDQG